VGLPWIAGIAGEALAMRPALFDRESPVQGEEVVLALVGGSFAVCGLIAWRRRPDSRSGMLVVATGLLFYVRPLLAQIGGELALTLLILLVDLWIYPFVALLLTFLSGGRLQTRLDRLLVAAYAIPLVFGQLLWMLSTRSTATCCSRGPTERIVAAGDAERRRLERNLHDGAQQRLVAIAMQLHVLELQLGNDLPRRRPSAGPAPSSPSRCPSCASSPAASTPPSSSTGSPPH
jgi:signal transduction histidine kinase